MTKRSAFAVTFVIFGHLSGSFYLLTVTLAIYVHGSSIIESCDVDWYVSGKPLPTNQRPFSYKPRCQHDLL